MNKPITHIEPDDDIGPLDENGQQIWSPEEEALLGNLDNDPTFWADIAAAEADIAAGRVYTHEQVVAMSAERRRRWRDEHGR
jgi:hypothetical protein